MLYYNYFELKKKVVHYIALKAYYVLHIAAQLKQTFE